MGVQLGRLLSAVANIYAMIKPTICRFQLYIIYPGCQLNTKNALYIGMSSRTHITDMIKAVGPIYI